MHKKINVLLSLYFIAFGATSRVLWLLGVKADFHACYKWICGCVFMLFTIGCVTRPS